MPANTANEKGLNALCICPRCPSYNECTRKGKELLFCFKGKSACMLDMNGCVCPSCPVEKLKSFSGVYFCMQGRAGSK